MTIYYSNTKKGFYDSIDEAAYKASNNWPEDLVEITEGLHGSIMAACNNGTGNLGWDSTNNLPLLVPNAPPTIDQLAFLNESAIQAFLNTTAKSRGYSDIKSACAYASPVALVPSTSPSFAQCEKFRLEGNALQSWMALTWAEAYAYLATVSAGTNPMPTPAEAVAMIPPFTWPD